MRTVFVNPRRKARKSKRKNPKKSQSSAVRAAYARGKRAAMKNPRRRRRTKRKSTRRRRRNAGVASFVANPLILSNPRRKPARRRRRKNPMPSLNEMFKTVARSAGGAAIGVGANTFVINNIDSPYFRHAARIGSSVLAGILLDGKLGASAGGALMYPSMQEFALMIGGTAAAAGEDTSADLDMLAADLADVLDDVGEEEEALVDW